MECNADSYSAAGSTSCLPCPSGLIATKGASTCAAPPSATATASVSASATSTPVANANVDLRLLLGGVDLALFDQTRRAATLEALAAALASAAGVPADAVAVRRVRDVSIPAAPVVIFTNPLFASDFAQRRVRRLGGAGSAVIEADLRVQLASTSTAAALGATLALASSSVAADVTQALQGSPLATAHVVGASIQAYPGASSAAIAASASASATSTGAVVGIAVVLAAIVGGLYYRHRRREAVVPDAVASEKLQRTVTRKQGGGDADRDEDVEKGADDKLGAAKRMVDLSTTALTLSTPSAPLQRLHPSSAIVANALSSAAGGVAAALTAAAPSVPLVGLALTAIAVLLSQLQGMRVAEREASTLAARLARLHTLVQRAASSAEDKGKGNGNEGDVSAAFVDEHPGIFRGLVTTLRSAERALAQIGERSRLGAFVGSTGDTERVTAIDRTISLHVAELSAALSAETMVSLRALHSKIRQAPPMLQQPKLSPPLPPFSMCIAIGDLDFEPPLEQQLQTADRGANGVVVLANWRAHALPVAVKVLNARMATGEAAIPITAWLAEAELMRRLREHRPQFVVTLFGISATLDALGHTDRYLVVMEQLGGGSLRAALDAYQARGRQPPLATALQWLLETARGVAECHAAGVVHSDIKAANVVLDGARRAKLGDLGSGRVTRGLSATASALAVTATSAGTGRSSVLWLSSELVDDPKLLPSTSSDVFAWAITAWEIISCRLPYHGADNLLQFDVLRPRVMMDLVSGALRPDLAAVRADTPPAVVELVRRCWAAEPRDRPEMSEIVRALEAATAALAALRNAAAERQVQAAASDAQSDALRAAAAAAAEEDARAAAAELAALRASIGEARTKRLEAIQHRREEAEAALRAEAAAAAASLEAEGAAWLATETACAEEALASRRQRLVDEAAAARTRRLQEGGAGLGDADRTRIMAEFDAEQRAVEARVEEERARQRAALEVRVEQRRAAKACVTEERAAACQRELEERARREADAERARGDEEVLRASFEVDEEGH